MWWHWGTMYPPSGGPTPGEGWVAKSLKSFIFCFKAPQSIEMVRFVSKVFGCNKKARRIGGLFCLYFYFTGFGGNDLPSWLRFLLFRMSGLGDLLTLRGLTREKQILRLRLQDDSVECGSRPFFVPTVRTAGPSTARFALGRDDKSEELRSGMTGDGSCGAPQRSARSMAALRMEVVGAPSGSVWGTQAGMMATSYACLSRRWRTFQSSRRRSGRRPALWLVLVWDRA